VNIYGVIGGEREKLRGDFEEEEEQEEEQEQEQEQDKEGGASARLRLGVGRGGIDFRLPKKRMRIPKRKTFIAS
jgi:hypothetical protein